MVCFLEALDNAGDDRAVRLLDEFREMPIYAMYPSAGLGLSQ
jgi:hypothetical protein